VPELGAASTTKLVAVLGAFPAFVAVDISGAVRGGGARSRTALAWLAGVLDSMG